MKFVRHMFVFRNEPWNTKYVIRHACVRSLQRIMQHQNKKGVLSEPKPDGSFDGGVMQVRIRAFQCSFGLMDKAMDLETEDCGFEPEWSFEF